MVSAIEIEPVRVELNQEVSLRAVVQDAETAVEALIYEWAADGGAFTGEGASVTWRPPEDAETPADYVLRLTVREPYGTPGADGVQPENRVTATSPAVRVHDSPRELRKLSLDFLEKFADSDVDPEDCLVDFSSSCSGKQQELKDIEDNRKYYENLSSSLDFRRVTIGGDGMSASMLVKCEFRTKIITCPPDKPNCVVGSIGSTRGDCRLTGVYEAQRWWLCTSTYKPDTGSLLPRFFGAH